MNRHQIDELISRSERDHRFRVALATDPVAAALEAGFELEPEERAALRAMDWQASDEELKARTAAISGPCVA